MVVLLRNLLLLVAASSFYTSSLAHVIPESKALVARGLTPRAGADVGGHSGDHSSGEDVKGPDGSGDEHMVEDAPSGSNSPVFVPGSPLERYTPIQGDHPTLKDLQNDHDLRTELLKEDLTKTGRDRRGVAYSLATKAQVQKKLPNPSRLMLWTDGVSSARSGDFIKAKPDLYGDGKYLYYFKEDFWPENFETELGEEFYPQTVICRMSVGMVAGSGAKDVDVVMAWEGDTPKSIFTRWSGNKADIGPTFTGTERGQLAANKAVERIWLWNNNHPEKGILAWVDPAVPDAIPKDYTGPPPDTRSRDDPSWTADSYPVDNVPLTMPGYEDSEEAH